MPVNVVKTPHQEDLWEQAKKQVSKEYDLDEGSDRFYALTNSIYQRMKSGSGSKKPKKKVVVKSAGSNKRLSFLAADIKDETEGIRDYAEQIKDLEAQGKKEEAAKLKHILVEEKQHKQILIGMSKPGGSKPASNKSAGSRTAKATNLEQLASAVHDIWIDWAKHISRRVSQTWRDRWKKLYVPYEELPEDEKEKDREQAEKILDVKKSAVMYCGRLLVKSANKDKPEIKSSDRYAYKTNEKDPIYIPVNRLETPYQTDAALDEDKIKENMKKIKRGEAMPPLIIGLHYDVHDGHHRLEAAKRSGHTHVPCVVGGMNERRVQAAEKRYRKLYKRRCGVPLIIGGRLLVGQTQL